MKTVIGRMVRETMTESWCGCAWYQLCQTESVGANRVSRVVRWIGCRSGKVMDVACDLGEEATVSSGCCERSGQPEGRHLPGTSESRRRQQTLLPQPWLIL